MKLPDGYSYGLFFNLATGKQLDIFGKREGVERKHWWIFKEPDSWYKERIAKQAWKNVLSLRFQESGKTLL